LFKKKKGVIMVLSSILFFGLLCLSLKYPLAETNAKAKAKKSNITSVADKTFPKEAVIENKADKQHGEAKEPGNDELSSEAKTETEVKLDTGTSAAKSGGSSSTSSGSKSSSGSTSSSSTSGSGSNGGGTSGGSTTPSKPSETKPAPPAPTPEPKPQPQPTLKPFTVPASNSFSSVCQSTDPDRSELLVVMDSSDNYEAQLNELYDVIAPVIGASIATEAVSYARTKTEAHMSLDKSWYVTGRRLRLGSTWGSWGVSFYSWRK
jgi:hypothetical protein